MAQAVELRAVEPIERGRSWTRWLWLSWLIVPIALSSVIPLEEDTVPGGVGRDPYYDYWLLWIEVLPLSLAATALAVTGAAWPRRVASIMLTLTGVALLIGGSWFVVRGSDRVYTHIETSPSRSGWWVLTAFLLAIATISPHW